ncbi:MAG TPA: hypothetical protein PLL30_03915 [Candidatus Krumholzibacteria bacterium]|nr:hypothetical protein [Candidatus Krumholzibacteria bacterium]HPD70918.1 hypothetical protein [Candidatus Krumholzibacteria bacterium]HRY39382.1 hypothetical protein [Candidatus Krumholzibacteria bacterium]
MSTQQDFARSRAVLLGLAGLLLLAACGDGGGDRTRGEKTAAAADAPRPAVQPPADAPARPATGAVALAGVTFQPPAAWRDLGPSGMRQAQYQLAPVAGDPAPAEVNVFYFGPASGGGTEANLQRWIGQMSLPDGGDPAATAERRSFEVAGMPAHVVAVDGTYEAGGMGMPAGGSGGPQAGYRLVGVVLEGPQGSLFFKLTGPAATARAMETGLLAMVQGARREAAIPAAGG